MSTNEAYTKKHYHKKIEETRTRYRYIVRYRIVAEYKQKVFFFHYELTNSILKKWLTRRLKEKVKVIIIIKLF
jgi:hypothetical protein